MKQPTTPSASPAARPCPRCGALLALEATRECPQCLFELALQPDRAAPDDQVPTREELQPLFPDHELLELLGRGGMGAVYRARQKKLDRMVAIKVLLPDLGRDPQFSERFTREAMALARLRHPGIVGIHDFGRAGPFFHLIMEYVDGASLRDLLTEGRLGPRDVLAFVPQLCDALQYAHEHGIVHRDIKPENILIDREGRVQIADFGLAKLAGGDTVPPPLTGREQVVGTPHYMAQEQMRTSHLVDHRADLYSLGVVLYEMLTGQLPIGRFQPPSSRARTPEALDRVVMKSLESDPAERYQDAAGLKHDVAAASNSAAGAPAPDAPTDPETQRAAEQTVPTVPWPSLACSLPWLRVQPWISPDKVYSSLGPFLGEVEFTGWRLDVNGIPMWLTAVLSVALVTAVVLRARGQAVARWLPVSLAGSGLLLCGLVLAVAVQHEASSPAIGLLLATVVFAAQVWSELQQLLRARRR